MVETVTKCKHHVDPRKCTYGREGGTTIYCQFDESQSVWERHPERHRDFPMKPSPDKCQYPELFHKGLPGKPRRLYKDKLPSFPGPYCDLEWIKEIRVSQK